MPINNSLTRADAPEISGWGLPSSTHENLTLGADGSVYTAPANGWYKIAKLGSQGKYVTLRVPGCAETTCFNAQSGAARLTAVAPILKGQTVTVLYTASGETQNFSFIYAEGEL